MSSMAYTAEEVELGRAVRAYRTASAKIKQGGTDAFIVKQNGLACAARERIIQYACLVADQRAEVVPKSLQ